MAAAPRQRIILLCCAVLLTSIGAAAPGERGPQRQPPAIAPAHPVDIILGRPTDTSIVLSVLCSADTKAVIAYGAQTSDLSAHTGTESFQQGEPREIVLEKLQPETRYCYQLLDAVTRKPLLEGSFRTRRTPGSTFTFTITADSHLDQNTDTALYQRTLANALADAPDFHIDLGDTFMTGKHANRENAAGQYLAQRFYFGQLCRSAPLFLVLGNHDGEESKLRRGADSLAVWSNTMRKRYFPNPVPDGFYTGNATRDPLAGLLQDYYAWQWGDALFLALDPYWHSSGGRSDDGWNLTLGAEQYAWLKKTVETSKAMFKLVFVHQLVGGLGMQGRGGAEAAPFGEWGGRNADGIDGFEAHRPGWDMPIHQLLVQNHVAIVFHGHDHLFAKQDLDGLVYQEVPQPGFAGLGSPRAAEYGYRDGVILGGSGHMRVTVSPDTLSVDYVRVYAAGAEDTGHSNRQVSCSYTIAGHDDATLRKP